jgi:hypothetical protein
LAGFNLDRSMGHAVVLNVHDSSVDVLYMTMRFLVG